jgi:hypothetical protein
MLPGSPLGELPAFHWEKCDKNVAKYILKNIHTSK